MKQFHVTVTHAFGLTTEVVSAKDEDSAKRKAIKQFNKRISLFQGNRLAIGAYVSNKGI